MAATSAERVIYASKSRKWNSTQSNKFLVEFPTEHAENLEWIRKQDEETARRRVSEEHRLQDETRGLKEQGMEVAKRKGDGRAKWIAIGVVGLVLAMRAWQRYKEGAV
jgi:hypothetical protein